MSDTEKPKLRQANDNPWYCLATLYGEQAKGAQVWDYDRDLAAKNRMAWNRWMAGVLSDEQRADLVKKGFPEPELVPLTAAEKSALCSAFASRMGRSKEAPPDPAGGADFADTNFDVAVVFEGYLFAGNANFSSATFSGGAFFDSATFSGDAFFGSATFSGDADFGSATFSGDADFGSATFSGLALFGSATFSGNADFGWAAFSASTNFINAGFKANTDFAYARFKTAVPDFRGAAMHEATDWHGVDWPPPPKDKPAAQEQVYAYERLKQEMERLKKHEDEQSFFRKELRARRGLAPLRSGAWLLNYAYEALSDYGQSIVKPLLWLFGLFAVGSTIFAETAALKGARMPISSAAGLSFANIFSFLPIKRDIMTSEMITCLSGVAQIAGAVQSLFGALLLFLLGLALRSRFRMR